MLNRQETDWSEIKNEVKKLNPTVFEIIDELNPKLPINKLSYPYGFTITDDQNFYMPNNKGGYETLSTDDLPLFLSLDKKIEVFLESDNRLIPDTIYGKGSFFPVITSVGDSEVITRPKSPYTWTAGLRNIIINHAIVVSKNYNRYREERNLDLNLDVENPESHFHLVKNYSNNYEKKWTANFFAFGQDWINKINNDKKWRDFKIFLIDRERNVDSYRANIMFLEYAMNEIILNNKINIMPHTFELMKQIATIALGFMPSYRPALDDSGAPADEFLKDYSEIFHSITIPFIYEPAYIGESNNHLYLSVSAANYFINERKNIRISYYLDELKKYFDFILEGLSKHKLTKGSAYGDLYKKLELKYYTAQGSKGKVLGSSHLYINDKRFSELHNRYATKFADNFVQRTIFNQAVISIKMNQN